MITRNFLSHKIKGPPIEEKNVACVTKSLTLTLKKKNFQNQFGNYKKKKKAQIDFHRK